MIGIQQLSLVLYTFLVSGYVVLDGYDLGAGILHVFRFGEIEKKQSLKIIGSKWDWNEIWLVAGGSVLFIGAPKVSAVIFQSFRPVWFVLLFALSCKPILVSFRMKAENFVIKKFLDIGISLACSFVALCAGFLAGKLILGIPIEKSGQITTMPISFFCPYCLLMGFTGICLFALHGAFFLMQDSTGKKRDRLGKLSIFFSIVSMMLYLSCLIVLRTQHNAVFSRVLSSPFSVFIMSLGLVACASSLLLQARESFVQAFGLSYVSLLAPLISVSLIGLAPIYTSIQFEDHLVTPINNLKDSLDALALLQEDL